MRKLFLIYSIKKILAITKSSVAGYGFKFGSTYGLITNRGLKFLSLPWIETNPDLIIYSMFEFI